MNNLKDIPYEVKIMIVVLFSIMIIGLTLLGIYYLCNLNRDELPIINEQPKTVEEIIAETEQRNNQIKFIYKDEGYELTKDKVTDDIFEEFYLKIKLLIMSHKYDEASGLAIDFMSDYNLDTMKNRSLVSSLMDLYGFSEVETSRKIEIITEIKDAELFMYLFYDLKPEEQAILVPDLNQVVIPQEEEMLLLNKEECGMYESDAYKYYSETDVTHPYKLLIQVGSQTYNFYYTISDKIYNKITKIEAVSSELYTTYDEYLKINQLKIPEISF